MATKGREGEEALQRVSVLASQPVLYALPHGRALATGLLGRGRGLGIRPYLKRNTCTGEERVNRSTELLSLNER